MIKNIVFDFGGVIVDLSRDNAVKAFESIGVVDAEQLLDKYHQRGLFLAVEDGSITAEEFCKQLGDLYNKEISYEEARTAWLAFFLNDPRYRLDYITELRKKYNVYILSNTNPFVMSWARSAELSSAGKPLDDYADKVYLSYQVKHMKPEREFFDFMIADSGLNPAESIFVDDGAANVEMGKKLGFLTLQPLSGEDWRVRLDEMLQR